MIRVRLENFLDEWWYPRRENLSFHRHKPPVDHSGAIKALALHLHIHSFDRAKASLIRPEVRLPKRNVRDQCNNYSKHQRQRAPVHGIWRRVRGHREGTRDQEDDEEADSQPIDDVSACLAEEERRWL